METIRLDDIWPLVQKLSDEERQKLREKLDLQSTSRVSRKEYWQKLDRFAAEMAKEGANFELDEVVRMVREDRDNR